MRALYFTDASLKILIRKRTAENGVTETLHYYSKRFPDLTLKETTVTDLRTATSYTSGFRFTGTSIQKCGTSSNWKRIRCTG